MRSPSKEEAIQFATMLHVGVPPSQAILYFASEEEAADPTFLIELRDAWLKHREVGKEVNRLQGGNWEDLSLEQRIQIALDKNYAEKAFFLYSNNFNEVSGADYTKLQEARKVLEAKMAGTSGKLNVLDQFMEDVKTGKVKLGTQRPVEVVQLN